MENLDNKEQLQLIVKQIVKRACVFTNHNKTKNTVGTITLLLRDWSKSQQSDLPPEKIQIVVDSATTIIDFLVSISADVEILKKMQAGG